MMAPSAASGRVRPPRGGQPALDGAGNGARPVGRNVERLLAPWVPGDGAVGGVTVTAAASVDGANDGGGAGGQMGAVGVGVAGDGRRSEIEIKKYQLKELPGIIFSGNVKYLIR